MFFPSNSNSCFSNQFQFVFCETIPIRIFSNSNSCFSNQFQFLFLFNSNSCFPCKFQFQFVFFTSIPIPIVKYCHPIHTDFPLAFTNKFCLDGCVFCGLRKSGATGFEICGRIIQINGSALYLARKIPKI
jgi:hypothetical protein